MCLKIEIGNATCDPALMLTCVPYEFLRHNSPVFLLKPPRQAQSMSPHNVRLPVTPESPALLELGPLMWHTNPQQLCVHRAIQSPSAGPRCVSRTHAHHQAGIWRSRVLGQNCATGTANLQDLSICPAYHGTQLNNCCLCRCSFLHTKPPTCSRTSSPTRPCGVSNPGSLRGATGV